MVFHSRCTHCDNPAVFDDLQDWLRYPVCATCRPPQNTCVICETIFIDHHAENYLRTHQGRCLECNKAVRKVLAILELCKASAHPETYNGRKWLDPWKPIPDDPLRAEVADLDPHDYLDYYASLPDTGREYIPDFWDDDELLDAPLPKIRRYNVRPESFTFVDPLENLIGEQLLDRMS